VSFVVTGGAGFIGSAVVDRLAKQGSSVHVIDNFSTGSRQNLVEAQDVLGARLIVHDLDIRSPEVTDLIAEISPRTVYHLAAQADVRVSVERPDLDAAVNLVGSLNVFQGALSAGTQKIVFAASGGTLYGDPATIPTPESSVWKPIAPYGITKKAALDYLAFYHDTHGIDFAALALANVYGPRQDPHGEAGVVAIFAGRFLEGEPPLIYGDGQQTRDFVFVGDVADAFVSAETKGSRLVANVGTGLETTVNELFGVMASLTGWEGDARYAPARIGELHRSALDPSLAAQALGWKPATSLRDGLSQTLDFFKQRPTDRESTPS
jgi:UDP-glucose 4-epimerase